MESMTRSLGCALLLVVGLTACLERYESKYAGNIPISVSNKASSNVLVYIRPAGATEWGKRWGALDAGKDGTYKVKPGRYDIRVRSFSMGTLGPSSEELAVDVQGPIDIVAAERQLQVPASAKLFILGSGPEGTQL